MLHLTDGGAHRMKIEFASEGAKTAPAIFGTGYSFLTESVTAANLTMIYIFLQIAYLLWKWHKEVNEEKKRNGKRLNPKD